MLSLIREHRRFFLGATLAGFGLRLLFFFYFPTLTDDSRIYADVATNWLQHGIYGQTQASQIVPTDTRLPGYPAFLAAIFWLFGMGNFRAVMLAQILVDLATCAIVADLARRVASDHAARIAFMLAALCPFSANYSAAVLTETLEIFFTALALDCATAALEMLESGQKPDAGRKNIKLWAATGAAIACCILLRPDGGIVLAAVLLYLVVVIWKRRARQKNRQKNLANLVVAALIVGVFALAPLIPWTIRNFHTLHHFQPLAPRYANESDEFALAGFNRWVKTWMAEYTTVEDIYWSVPGDKIDAAKLPSRAFDNAAEREATLAVIADYNQTQEMTPQLDARLGELAAERIRAHPVRYYVALPLVRIADMWLRPRTTILPPDPRWWEFNDDPRESVLAVAFGLLNLAYVGAAFLALVFLTLLRSPSEIRWIGLLVGFVVLRSAFLGTLENPEPRYTLECYPVVVVLAAAWAAGFGGRRFWVAQRFSAALSRRYL